jgi:hypothetical protein
MAICSDLRAHARAREPVPSTNNFFISDTCAREGVHAATPVIPYADARCEKRTFSLDPAVSL